MLHGPAIRGSLRSRGSRSGFVHAPAALDAVETVSLMPFILTRGLHSPPKGIRKRHGPFLEHPTKRHGGSLVWCRHYNAFASERRAGCGWRRQKHGAQQAGHRHAARAHMTKVLRFALPVAATGILEQLFNASGIMIVGNFSQSDGTAAVAAVAPTRPSPDSSSTCSSASLSARTSSSPTPSDEAAAKRCATPCTRPSSPP